jgi:hypothetical protein
MTRKEFRVLATNGDWVREILYFIQGPKGDIYYGEPGSKNYRASLHSSGVAHTKSGEHVIRQGQGTKLSELKGLRQLFGMSMGKLTFAHLGKPFSGKKVDGLVLIDIRKFKSDAIGVMAFLLEPVNADKLNMLLKILHEPQFTVFTETEPWLVIAVHTHKFHMGEKAAT